MSTDQRRQQQHRHWNRSSSGGWARNPRGESYAPFHQSASGAEDREELLELKRLDDEAFECEKLFRELNDKLNSGYRRLVKFQAELRKRHGEMKVEAKALEDEKRAVAALKLKTEKDLEEMRSEREQLERASTDIAIQLAELKKTQREMEKNKANHERVAKDQKVSMAERCQQNLQAPPAEAPAEQQALVIPKPEQQLDAPVAKRLKVAKPDPASKKRLLRPVTVESALQEDAPGLYELLEERGLLEDMEVIAGEWLDGSGESSSKDENFKRLGEVISKHWRPTLSRDIPRLRAQPVNNSKPNYCLPCLVSLIEQTRVLKQRKWPVKWGWCRPLNAFLFVFEKHNRIVVERPEYGYATYFFELFQSVPVKWQVDRLIQAMSCITNCRAALLENRPLEASLLLPEEASVLEHYGWTPNTGIGTLLNFCDRVLHDYKLDDDAGEWKSRIGKLLLDGHDQGSIVTSKLAETQDQAPQIPKLEQDPTLNQQQLMLIPIKQESCY